MSNEQPSLAQAIGVRLRDLRTEADWTQENIAAIARVLGLGWTRSTVAAIEAAERSLSIEEFFCLPIIYPTLGKLANLFQDREHGRFVELRFSERRGLVAPEAHLRALLEGKVASREIADALHELDALGVEQNRALFGRLVEQIRESVYKPDQAEGITLHIHDEVHVQAATEVELAQVVEEESAQPITVRQGKLAATDPAAVASMSGHKTLGEWDDPAAERVYSNLPPSLQQRRSEIEAAAKGEAERKAARKLGISPLLVSMVAFRLYDRSLSEERDMRVIESLPKGASGRTMQALRGHVTRKILAELTRRIDHYQKG